jgi:hypothetical protein
MDEYPLNRSEPDTSVNAGRLLAGNRQSGLGRRQFRGRRPLVRVGLLWFGNGGDTTASGCALCWKGSRKSLGGLVLNQLGDGFAAWSITKISTDRLERSNLSPNSLMKRRKESVLSL